MPDQLLSGEFAMSDGTGSSSGITSGQKRPGRVVSVRVRGKLPTSSAPTDEDERLTLEGLRVSHAILRDIASARPGSAIERSALELIDGIWDAHAQASALRSEAAASFRRFASSLDQADLPKRSLRASEPAPAAPIELVASVARESQTTSPAPAKQGATASASAPGIYEPSPDQVATWSAARDLDLTLRPESRFSDCIAAYVARRKANNPTVQVSSVIYPARLWIALVGDRQMGAYDALDLQRFVDKAKHVPPNFEKRYPGKAIAEIVEENSEFKLGAPKRKTLGDTWVATLKSVFSFHAKHARTRSPFAGVTVDLPRVLAKPTKHPAPPISVTNAAFRIGVRSDNEVDAFLPLIAYATGRRIGLLTYLQGTSFRIENGTGVVYAIVSQTIDTPDGMILTPYKTDESAGEFVIPRFVVETGFVSWAMAKGPGFVFASAQRAKDPADTASKRLNSLLASARSQVAESTKGTAHGWRGQAEDRFGERSISSGACRLQVGHAPGDEHERYKSGRLPSPDALKLFEAAPDDGIDLSPFKSIDFTRFEQ